MNNSGINTTAVNQEAIKVGSAAKQSDPAPRIMSRPFVDRTMTRPATNRTMTRAATDRTMKRTA